MNISIKNLNNQSGVTLTETLMATAVGVVIIATTFTIFNAQQDSLTSANEELLIHSKGRLAAESLAKDIRLVGFGLPPGAQILSISENSITYRAALSDLQTSIPNASDWKTSLDARLGETAFHRYQDLLFPALPPNNIISLQEGDTPLYDISHIFPDFGALRLKHEGLNPTLSFSGS